MKCVPLQRLGYEDVSFTGVVAMSLFWSVGNRTVYRDAGRPDNMLYYTVSGTRSYREEGKEPFEIGPGDLMLMPAASCYVSTVTGEEGTKGFCLQFTLRDAEGRPCKLDESVVRLMHDEDGQIRQLFEKLLGASMQKGTALRVKELLIRLLEQVCRLPDREVGAELYPAIRYMETHLQSPVRAEEMAKLCHMSLSTFSRRFHVLTGQPAAAYHRALRLEKSRELLESGLCTVEQAAFTMGFYDKAHFSRCFQTHFGVNPGDCRKG